MLKGRIMIKVLFLNYSLVITLSFLSILNCKSKLPFNKEFPEPSIAILDPLSAIACDTCFSCNFMISGSSEGLASKANYKIYVMVQQYDSFIVQHPAATLKSDGTWTAQATIGNSVNPAYNGQRFNIMAIADRNEIFSTLTSIKNLANFNDEDYPKSQLVGLVVQRASLLKITSPFAEVKNEADPDTSNQIQFRIHGTADGIARNHNCRVFILVRPHSAVNCGWRIQFPDGSDPNYFFDYQTGSWTASAKLEYDNSEPVLDGDSLRLLAVSTHRLDLMTKIGTKYIPDNELKRELPESLVTYSNEVFLIARRHSTLTIDYTPYLIAQEPDTNENCYFKIQGEATGLILNSNFEIYAVVEFEKAAANVNCTARKWQATILPTKKEYLDSQPIEVYATARLKNRTYYYLRSEKLNSTVKRKLVKRIEKIGQRPFKIEIISVSAAYITRQGDGSILPIDLLGNNKGEELLDIGNDLRGIARSLDGLKVYVCDYTSEDLKIINTSNKMIDIAKVGTHCKDIALAYDNRFAVLIKDNAICKVELNVKKASDQTLNGTPTDIVLVPLSYKAYVAMQDGKLLCFDDITQDFQHQIVLDLSSISINAIAITPDGQKICLALANGNVAIFDTNNNTIINNVVVGGNPQGIAITPDGKLALVANTVNNYPFDNKISAIDLINQIPAVVDTIKIENKSAFPVDIDITFDGKYAYIVNQSAENVSVIRLDMIK